MCNPPFDEQFVKKMAKILIKHLEKSELEITIFITIPVWDSESQKKIGIRDFGMNFEGFDLLKKSKYCKEHSILNRDKYPYYNYYTEKKAPASWTHAIILSNFQTTYKLDFFVKKWQEWSN